MNGAAKQFLVVFFATLILAFAGHAQSAIIRNHDADDTSRLVQGAMHILHQHCTVCHGPEKQKAGLRLDEFPNHLTSGKRSIIVPGKPDTSELYRRITSTHSEERMPPQGASLSAQEIESLKRWIESGAVWSKDTNPISAQGSKRLPWSFSPITRPAVPSLSTQLLVRTPVDAFIFKKLEENKLKPSPEADRVTLIRRLYLDLLGLLPTPDEVDSFVSDTNTKAYEMLVDRLLASSHFGEKWARPWLDIARYADSDGYEHDEPRPHAYHYRDWVIHAFNSDMPFDQFTIEQLAGDLLSNPKEEQYVASGFHRQTMRHNTPEMIVEEFRTKAIKDRVNTTGMVWMGLTVGCAECHPHKFDPISHADYYRLYAFFNDAQEKDISGDKSRTIMTFESKQRPTLIHLRGNPNTMGEPVEPGVPVTLPALNAAGKRANRLDLAKWLVSPRNPLTARVEANRIWKQLFGSGLVPTADDFGNRGQPPSHPALLDWLASELRDNGWSRKKLIKHIVNSATYRQSSRHRPELSKLDPSNTMLARQNRFRIDAENIYDISLQVAGVLQLDEIGGPSFQPPMPAQLDKKVINNNRLMETSETEDRYRRGLYIHVQRTYQHPFLNAYDTPDSSQSCAVRDRSQTPAQALMLMNDPIFQECTEKLQERIEKHSATNEARLLFGYRLCLGRLPTPAETLILLELLQRQEKSVSKAPWQGVSSVLLNMEAFTTRE